MKLHLPKLLRVALISATVTSSVATAYAVDAVVDVGLVDTTKAGAQHIIKEASTTDVTVGKDQAAGAFAANGKLITSTGAYTNDGSSITDGSGAVVTNHLKVTGKLTINDNGQVYLGGQIKKTGTGKKDSYSGLIADSVEVNGDGSVTNLNVGSAQIGTLTVNSGTAEIHTTGTPSGNSYQAYVGTDGKQALFTKGIVVNGGTLKIGYQAKAGSGSSHYGTWIGAKATVTQNGGTMTIAAQTRVGKDVTFTQTGGTFDTPTTVNGQLAFALSAGGTYNLEQIKPQDGSAAKSDPKFTIRRLALTNASSRAKVFNINQTATNGTINLTSGASVSGTGGFETTATSSLIQDSLNGVINFGGDFSKAPYEVDQSAGKIVLLDSAKMRFTNAAIQGSLTVGSNAMLSAEAVTLTSGTQLVVGGTFTIGTGTAGAVGVLNVTNGGTLNFVLDGTNAALTLSADTVTGWTMATGSQLGIGFTKEYLETLTPNEADGAKVYDFTAGVLVAKDTNNSVDLSTMSYTLAGLDDSYWTWSDKAELKEETNGDIKLTGQLTFNPWVDVTADNDHVMYEDDSVGGGIGIRITNETVTLSGDNNHSLGTMIDSSSVTLSHEDALGAGSVSSKGTSSLSTAENVVANLPQKITVETGTLAMQGKYKVADNVLTGGNAQEEAWFNAEGDSDTDGFYRAATANAYQVVEVKDGASLAVEAFDDVHVTINGTEYQLYDDGLAGSKLDYTEYDMRTRDHEASASSILEASGTTTRVVMLDTAGKLTVDADIEVDAAGGEIAVGSGKTVSGSIKNATLGGPTGAESASGIVTATLKEANTLTGKLTLGAGNALSAATVTTSGETSLTTAGGVTAELTGAITNTGTLSLSGNYDVSKMDDVPLPDTYIDVDGNVVDADSENGKNGFGQYGRFSVQVVNNVGENTGLELRNPGVEYTDTSVAVGTLKGELDANGTATFVGGTDHKLYRITDEQHKVSVSAIQQASGNQTTKVEMTAGELTANGSMEVKAEGGKLITAGSETVVSGSLENTSIAAQAGEISADITGASRVEVTGNSKLSGTNSYTGGTVIDGAELVLAAGTGVGTGDVELTNHGTLDMGGNALTNAIIVTGCTLRGAGAYAGDMDVLSELYLADATTANKVTLKNTGSLTGAALTVNHLNVQTSGNASVAGDLTINDNGTITLNNGKVLTVGGSLTLGAGTTLTLNGDYAAGTALLSSTGALTLGEVTLVYDDPTVELKQVGNSLVLVSSFRQEQADMAVQGNWGIATASRAFVNAVRGQHTNTGCIADGRGTAWAAVLGAWNDMDGADISVEGAAVGVDVKVGSRSSVGIAFGYAEGEVSPAGLSDVDQEGEYVALYGEHGLMKLRNNSCLSLDWVAAYGQTESRASGITWEQDSVQLNTRLNWNRKLTGRLCMSVFGGLEYFATGSDTARGVKSGSIQNLRGELGVGARYVAWGSPAVADGKLGVLRPGCEKLVLHGEIRYMNDMVRSNPVVRMNGVSGDGENPGRQGIGIEAGATYRISDRWSASANYGFNTMEDSREHRMNVGASYTF